MTRQCGQVTDLDSCGYVMGKQRGLFDGGLEYKFRLSDYIGMKLMSMPLQGTNSYLYLQGCICKEGILLPGIGLWESFGKLEELVGNGMP